jgi:hypothetical protein
VKITIFQSLELIPRRKLGLARSLWLLFGVMLLLAMIGTLGLLGLL